MNFFQRAEASPRKTLVRWGLGLAGALLLLAAARHVDWRQFRAALAGLRWLFILISLAVTTCAIGLRAYRLRLLLGVSESFVPVWRSVSLGYLGSFILPLGGGEITKVAALRRFLGIPAAQVATGILLDRILDVLGLALMIGLLASLGLAIRLRPGFVALALGGLAVVFLTIGMVLVLGRRRHPEGGTRGILRPGTRLGDAVAQIVQGLSPVQNPGLVLGLLAVQVGVVALDLTGIYVGFHAFWFARQLPVLAALNLGVLVMLGAALPMLPGSLGTHQVACMLALRPFGVTAAQAFAYSVVGQSLSFLLVALLGLVAVLAGADR